MVSPTSERLSQVYEIVQLGGIHGAIVAASVGAIACSVCARRLSRQSSPRRSPRVYTTSDRSPVGSSIKQVFIAATNTWRRTPGICRTGLIRAVSDRTDTARISPGASYAIRNDSGDGISDLPQVTYHDCYT